MKIIGKIALGSVYSDHGRILQSFLVVARDENARMWSAIVFEYNNEDDIYTGWRIGSLQEVIMTARYSQNVYLAEQNTDSSKIKEEILNEFINLTSEPKI